jgi:beta-phosphoglucomutase-like phosphatase (HAD superfamily)
MNNRNYTIKEVITEAVIFDMDGVLTDSEWLITETSSLMFLEKHKASVTHDDFLPSVGLGENSFPGGVAEKYGITAFDVEQDKARTYGIYGKIVPGKIKPLPGAVEFVRRCRDLGLKTALATSTDYTKMMVSLREIGLAPSPDGNGGGSVDSGGSFDACVNGPDVERRKPFPDIFLEAARRIAVPPERCWVVEDSPGGVTAAKAAGMRCLALLTTFPEAKIRQAGADIIVPDLSHIQAEALLRYEDRAD